MKLKIGDCEIPERCLRHVVLYNQATSVSFSGILVGEQSLQKRSELTRSAQLRAVPYEVTDINGINVSGLCDIKNLKFDDRGASIIKFSGQLVRPFQE